jgi:lysophospholipase L1-like esterase
LRYRVTATAATMCLLLTVFSAGLAACSSPPQRARTTAQHQLNLAGLSYYLALGDSLSQGVQPDGAGHSVTTTRGYADRLFSVLRRGHPSLELVKLGCSGETSFTMIKGGTCHYPAGSQLAQAAAFLRAHRTHTGLVTLDIGANDPNSCFIGAPLSKILTCMRSRVRLTIADLRTILSKLRAAGGRHMLIIGMNYYVPELAGWLHGIRGQEIAVLIERLVHGYNTLLGHVYRHYHVRVANVFAAFHSSDFSDRVTMPGIGKVPRNVATICQLTWSCSRTPNEHANDMGYAIIAVAFLLADER